MKSTDELLVNLRRDLVSSSDEKTRESGQRFFKEEVKMYGIKSATVVKLAKEHFQAVKGESKERIFELCEQLWKSGYMEESFVACNWSYFVNKSYTPGDFAVFERWVENYLDNWASCDTLCNHTVGTFLEMYPEFLGELINRWAKSSNRWMKRASAVSLIIPARNGKFLKEIFTLADIMLLDGDDMVQKGYGWMLKSASQAYQKEVFDYVVRNKAVMPRTALRYAIEKMPPELRAMAMSRS